MKKAAIAIDRRKLPIFERHLAQSGYRFEQAPGLGDDTMFLMVFTDNLAALGEVVRAANVEAAKTNPPRGLQP